jgi:hypothetical protein
MLPLFVISRNVLGLRTWLGERHCWELFFEGWVPQFLSNVSPGGQTALGGGRCAGKEKRFLLLSYHCFKNKEWLCKHSGGVCFIKSGIVLIDAAFGYSAATSSAGTQGLGRDVAGK